MVLGAAHLSACVGHGSIDYDPTVRDTPGTITLGDAKVYSREALINERAADIAWIDKLIEASEDPAKVSFKPALIREMEEISAFSTALGLRYDPAAAISFKRQNETGEIQQQIDVLKAQIQLEQLRRDIELIRAKLPDQTAPVNADLNKLGAPAATTTSTAVTPPDPSQVITTLNTLIASAAGRLTTEVKPIGKTEVTSSPQDDFRDRLAYRDMLKAARNAAALDELHDAGHNRLVRLNLQAMVTPDPANLRALGAIQVRIRDDGADGPTDVLANWLQKTNSQSPWRVDAATFKSHPELDTLENSGDFAQAQIGGFRMLAPVLQTENVALYPQPLLTRAGWDEDDLKDIRYFGEHTASLSVGGPALEAALIGLCRRGSPLALALDRADARTKSYALVRSANLAATNLGVPAPSPNALAKYARAKKYQDQVIDLIRDRPDCTSLVADYSPAAPTWRVLRRPELGSATQVRIYEVGPREQAQQISTVARSANSLALAASIAAADPASGVAGNLGAGFQRDVMNRASALDRAPEVVGYSVGGKRTFGWVIGPHATTDARGRAEVRQVAKSYDLSVDLSVPSWWSVLDLEVTTVWAPSPQKLARGALVAMDGEPKAEVKPEILPVTLVANLSDDQAFTQLLLQDSRRTPSLNELVGGPVNGCTATTLLLNGRNLWRAEKVLLLGLSLGREAITIAPDMEGIVVKVPPVEAIAGERAFRLNDNIRVLTPLGQVATPIAYDATLSGDACKPAAAAAAVDPAAVAIGKASPTSFSVPSLIRIDVTGKNLKKVEKVTLDGREMTITAAADGTSLRAELARDQAEGIEPGTVQLEFFADKKSVGPPQSIRITRN